MPERNDGIYIDWDKYEKSYPFTYTITSAEESRRVADMMRKAEEHSYLPFFLASFFCLGILGIIWIIMIASII